LRSTISTGDFTTVSDMEKKQRRTTPPMDSTTATAPRRTTLQSHHPRCRRRPNRRRPPPAADALPLALPLRPAQITTSAGPPPPPAIPLSPVTFISGAGYPCIPTLTVSLFLAGVMPVAASRVGPTSGSMPPPPSTASSVWSPVRWPTRLSQSLSVQPCFFVVKRKRDAMGGRRDAVGKDKAVGPTGAHTSQVDRGHDQPFRSHSAILDLHILILVYNR
jgi:hypothetical protein